MATNLRIVPIHPHSNPDFFSSDSLDFGIDYVLFSQISKLPTLVGEVSCFTDTGYDRINKDDFGDPLTYVEAGELSRLLKQYKHKDIKNKAITAFIEVLPKDMQIFLYWY